MKPLRPPRVALAITVLGSVAFTAPAVTTAAAAGRNPAHRTVVNASGLRISWASTADRPRLAPGTTLRVRVQRTAKAKRDTRARITVTRLAQGATKRRVVRRATVRRGTTSIQVGRKVGTRYRLAVQVGARTWRSTIEVGSPSTPEGCVPAGRLEAPVSATIGSRVPLAVVNTGTAVLTFGAKTGSERLVAGGWVPVEPPPDLTYSLWARPTRPGATGGHAAGIWSTMEPGTYRITLPVTATCDSVGAPVSPADPPVITLYSDAIAITAG